MFHEVWELKSFNQQKSLSWSFKGIGNGVIRYATYDFLIDFHCNHVSILHRFQDIITYFPKFKEVT